MFCVAERIKFSVEVLWVFLYTKAVMLCGRSYYLKLCFAVIIAVVCNHNALWPFILISISEMLWILEYSVAVMCSVY